MIFETMQERVALVGREEETVKEDKRALGEGTIEEKDEHVCTLVRHQETEEEWVMRLESIGRE